MPHAEAPLISVVLCTFNRCELMATALRSVCEQTMDPSCYEVIVVDNNSTDGTKQHVAEVSRRHRQVVYCFEGQQGLSLARNTGFRTAQGRYVAYIDDDCTVPKEWLAVAQEIIEGLGPALFGGPYHPSYNTPKPTWYRDNYGSYDCGSTARLLGTDEYLTGTNMFIRRTLLEQLGGFSPEVGMAGQRLGYGEEIAIQRRYRRQYSGEMIHYDPRLAVSHVVRAEKMKLYWCAHHMFTIGRDWQRVLNQTDDGCPSVGRAMFHGCRAFLRMAEGLVWRMFLRDRSRYPLIANYLYEEVLIELRTMGMAYAQLIARLYTMKTSASPNERCSM